MNNIIFLLLLVLILIACGHNDKPKVIYPQTENNESSEPAKDTSQIEISDIPIHIDSTNYLIHPIGEYSLYKGRNKVLFGSPGYGSGSFKIASHNGYRIAGNLHNLKFQRLDSDILKPLTNKNIRIKTITFLREIYDNTKKQILIYKIIDIDSNRDHLLNDEDIATLYISNIDGTGFTKLTARHRELVDWKVIKVQNRVYFRSIEDTNKNGEFDKRDKMYYHFIDFNNDELKTQSYNPI